MSRKKNKPIRPRRTDSRRLQGLLFVFFIFLYLFIWPHQVLAVACRTFSYGMWDLIPWLGIEPGLLYSEHGVFLDPGLPGKSFTVFLNEGVWFFFYIIIKQDDMLSLVFCVSFFWHVSFCLFCLFKVLSLAWLRIFFSPYIGDEAVLSQALHLATE